MTLTHQFADTKAKNFHHFEISWWLWLTSLQILKLLLQSKKFSQFWNILMTLTQAAAIKQLQRVEGIAMTCSLRGNLNLRFFCFLMLKKGAFFSSYKESRPQINKHLLSWWILQMAYISLLVVTAGRRNNDTRGTFPCQPRLDMCYCYFSFQCVISYFSASAHVTFLF